MKKELDQEWVYVSAARCPYGMSSGGIWFALENEPVQAPDLSKKSERAFIPSHICQLGTEFA